MAKRNGSGPRVYSYIRFSTPEQALGDSERRQLAQAEAYAKRLKLPFDETLRLLDRGKSGYHGVHRKKGVLGEFLASVERSEVPQGSTLVVENIDRLSREEMMDALEMILFGLVKHGIKIHTLDTGSTYDREALNGGRIWELIAHITRAHGESKRKSDLGKANWTQKRRRALEEGHILTRQIPAWLKVVDGKFEVIPEAATAVNMIFDLKLQGLGKTKLTNTMNAEAPWTPPKNPKRKTNGWRESYVQKILRERAVMGEYQPHRKVDGKRKPLGDPMPDYYPQVVPPEKFYAVQERFKVNRGKAGRTGKVGNLFTHIVVCAYCGGPMRYTDKGNGWKYLVCDQGRRGVTCRSHSVRYNELEELVLDNCHKLRPEQVLPSQDEATERVNTLRQRVQGLAGTLEDVAQQVDNLVDQVARTQNATLRDKYEAKLAALEEQRLATQAQKDAAEKELAEAEAGTQNFRKWKAGLKELREAIAGGEPEIRLRLRNHLRELIAKVEVFAVGFEREYNPDCPLPAGSLKTPTLGVEDFAEEVDAMLQEYAPEFARGRKYHAFLRELTKRRMSKEGRFYRVHFVTGARVDLVPPGSLASGKRLVVADRRRKAEWRFVTPDLDRLWREFTEKNGKTRIVK